MNTGRRPSRKRIALALAFAFATAASCARDEAAPAPAKPPVTPARRMVDALPFAIDEPGTYALSKDLDGASDEDGIVIRSDDVTIDLGGFALRGGARSGCGVRVEGERTGIAIRDGVLKAWGADGLDASQATGCSLAGLEASLNGGGGLRCGPSARVTSCRATFNWGGRGIDVGADSVVVDCAAEDNALGGIHAGGGSELRGCSSLRSTYGAGLRAGLASRLAGCSAVDDLRQGIVVGDGSLISAARVEGAVDVGIAAGADCELRDCEVRGVLDGDGFRTGAGAVLDRCRSFDNAGRGFATGADAELTGCEERGNHGDPAAANGSPSAPGGS